MKTVEVSKFCPECKSPNIQMEWKPYWRCRDCGLMWDWLAMTAAKAKRNTIADALTQGQSS